jgi:hypothetical protein
MALAAGSPQKAAAVLVSLGDRDGPDSDIGRQLRYSLHLSKVYRSYNCFFDEPGESAVKAGTFVTHFANGVHWDGAKDEDATLLIVGEGPATGTLGEEDK